MRQYTRAYDEQLRGYLQQKIEREEAGYRNHVKVMVASMVARGENAAHIAGILDIGEDVVVQWYRDLFLNQQELPFTIEDFSYYRDKNVLRADARTKGAIVKALVEETMSEEQALEALKVVQNVQTLRNWKLKYFRDYDIMIELPPGVEYSVKTAYAISAEAAEEIQEMIFHHDRIENEHASTLRDRDFRTIRRRNND